MSTDVVTKKSSINSFKSPLKNVFNCLIMCIAEDQLQERQLFLHL